jgi:hypothetical protein
MCRFAPSSQATAPSSAAWAGPESAYGSHGPAHAPEHVRCPGFALGIRYDTGKRYGLHFSLWGSGMYRVPLDTGGAGAFPRFTGVRCRGAAAGDDVLGQKYGSPVRRRYIPRQRTARRPTACRSIRAGSAMGPEPAALSSAAPSSVTDQAAVAVETPPAGTSTVRSRSARARPAAVMAWYTPIRASTSAAAARRAPVSVSPRPCPVGLCAATTRSRR